jgi:hypothetical protein
MLGPAKPRRLNQPIAVSLEDLVPADHFYRYLETKLDLSFVREWVRERTSSAAPPPCPKNVRVPDSQMPSTTRASLTTVSCSKTRPTIIVSIVGSADGFRDTNCARHPAGQAFRFL